MTGALGGDVVACTGTAAFDTALVGTGKTVTASGLTLTGAAAGNYVLSSTTATTTAAITAATVTPVVTAANKVYDGTTTATLTSCTVTGALGGDVVACTGTATFDTIHVGVGKTVTASGLTLTGAGASNYVLSSTTATTTANITPATVTPVITAANKVYDGTTTATLTSCSTGVVSGRRGGVHRHRRVRHRERGFGQDGDRDPDADGPGRRRLRPAVLDRVTTAAITPAVVTAGGHGGEQGLRRHHQCDAHELHRRRQWSGDDVVACTGSAAFDTAHVGAGKTVTASGLTLTGADAGNYVLAANHATTTAAITPATVTAVITAANKVYDGTTSATLTSCTVTGALEGGGGVYRHRGV